MNAFNHPGSGKSDGLATSQAGTGFIVFGFMALFLNDGGLVVAIILWAIGIGCKIYAPIAEEKHMDEIDRTLHRGKYSDEKK